MRKIIHIDMDAFYAAVEMRDDPALAGLPVAVGGSPAERGVIATANYVARSHGVRSAIASARALQLCPELIILPPRFEVYRFESRRIRAIFRRYTELVEPMSLDEAYLDVSACSELGGSATRIAEAIRQEIRTATELTASAGVAPNKFLAKVASDWRKPDGLTVISPSRVEAFVRDLPVRRIPGVGRVTEKHMKSLGILTCADLQRYEPGDLIGLFGKWGERLFELCRGQDDRPVVPEQVSRQLSVERTFADDLPDRQICQQRLREIYFEFERRFERANVAERVRGCRVKVRFDDFRTTTVERACQGQPTWDDFIDLLDEALARGERPVRLLGLGVRLCGPNDTRRPVQLELWPQDAGGGEGT
jgi:DNA polymerase-4